MRKNSILALLATGVLPVSAFAAIDIPGVATDKGSWDLSGVSNVETDGDGMITVPGAQGGYPACTIANLPAGEYVITGDLVNAKFVVLLDGKEVTLSEDGTFTTTAAGKLVIVVRALDMSASYAFGNVKLALNVDLDQIQQDLQALMPTGTLTAPSEYMKDYNTDEITGADVIAEYESLLDKDAIEAAIEAVNPAGATPEQQLEAYLTYVNNDVKGKVEAYAEAVKAYMNGVQEDDEWVKYPIGTINEWAETLHANIEDHNADLKKLNSTAIDAPGYVKQLENLKADIAETGHTEALATEIAAVEAAIAAVQAEIQENWDAEGVQEGKAEYEQVDFSAVEAALDALDNAHSALIDNEKNYELKWLPKYQELTNAYINAQQVIKDLYKDEPGQKERQDSVMVAVTAIYNDAVNSLEVSYGDGECTSEEYINDKAKIDAAIAALEARTDEDTANLKDEQAALQAGKDLVGGVTDALDAITINADAYTKSALDAEKAALEAEVAELQKEIDDIYASTEVLTDEYINTTFQEEIDALQAKIDEFAAKVETANQLGALTTALNDARNQISKDENNTYLKGLDSEFGVDVVDMMNGSYVSIKDAIEQQQEIFDEDYTQVSSTSLEDIKASINGDDDSYLTNGLKMAKDFADAYKIALPDLAAANAYVYYINSNTLAFPVKVTSTLEGVGVDKVNGVDPTPYWDEAKEFQATAQKIVDDLKAARNNTPQNAFDAIEQVMADITAADLATAIPAAKIVYMKDVIGSEDGNWSNLEELHFGLDDLAAQMAELVDDNGEKYAGYAAVEALYNAANEALGKVDTDFGAADDSAKLEKVNKDAKAVIAQLQKVQNEIDKVVKNYKAYQTVLALVQQIDDKADAAKQYAEEHSYEPARSTWNDKVDEQVEAAAAVETALEKAYNAVEMLKSVNGKTNEATLTAEINEILAWFAAFENNVDQNELAHNALLDESAAVTALVDEVNTTIQSAEVPIILESGENAADVLKGYIDELSELDTELYNIYKDVDCKGQELAGSADDPTLMYKYEELQAKINDLRASLDDDYAKALKEYNEKYIAENWSAYRTDMMDVYTQAIINIDEYQAAVQSCASLAANEEIQDGVDHQPVYDYAPEIQALLAEVTAMLNNSWPSKVNGEANADQHKLTEADLADFIARAEEIIDGIGEVYSQKVDKITEAAEAVLADAQSRVETLISDTEAELTAAGCDEESIAATVKGAKDALTRAATMAQTPLDGPDVPAYVVGIAGAVNLLDGVEITDAQKTAAAVSTFNNAVAAVEEAIKEAQTTLDESTLPQSKKDEFQARIDEATQELNGYKNDVVTLENLLEELDKVNGIDVASIQADIDQAIADNEANNDNKEALDAKVETLQESLDALNDWVEQLLVAADVPMTTLQAQVTAVQDAINAAYNDELLSDDAEVADLEAQIEAVQAAIDNAYASAYQLEMKRLSEELLDANRAYNEAAKRYEEETGVAEYPDTDEGKEYTAKIEEQALAIGSAAIPEGTVPTEAQQQNLVDIQTALLNIQIDLGYLTTADVLATLNEAAENAIATINESKDALGNYAADKYAADYDALVAEVEALQQQWTENTASVIVQEGVYLSDINAIVNNKLAELDAEAAAYQADREANAAHEAASDAAYATLNAELAELRAAFEETAGYVEEYGAPLGFGYESYLNWCEYDLADLQAALDKAKADYTCVDFSWSDYDQFTWVTNDINYINKDLWNRVTSNYRDQLNVAYTNTMRAFYNANDLVDRDGLDAALQALNTQKTKLNTLVTDGDAEKGVAYVEKAKELIAAYEALKQAIQDAEYTAGDIDGSGEVTAEDYEALIDLLGQIVDSTDFDNPAYDVNGDGKLTIADIASIIDLLMGRDTDAPVLARMRMVNDNNAVYVVRTSVNNGVSRYAVMLNNSANLFGAQMDIVLGNGMEIVSEGVAQRTSDSEFYGSTTKNGNHRIILSSINMETFDGSEGAIVYIDVRGDGELSVDNVYGLDVQGRVYDINVMSNVTGIESVTVDAQDADIYNVGGQKLNRTERGVNIIRNNDGSVNKVLVK